jgi:hypothetical protein
MRNAAMRSSVAQLRKATRACKGCGNILLNRLHLGDISTGQPEEARFGHQRRAAFRPCLTRALQPRTRPARLAHSSASERSRGTSARTAVEAVARQFGGFVPPLHRLCAAIGSANGSSAGSKSGERAAFDGRPRTSAPAPSTPPDRRQTTRPTRARRSS